jgi:thioredoxin 1
MSLANLFEGRTRPVVVQFHARWCGPCKQLTPRVEAMEKEFADSVDVVRIDVDEDAEAAREAGVRSVPTLVVYRDGREVRRHAGLLDAQGLRTLFRSAFDESAAQERTGPPAWHLPAKFAAALALFVAAGLHPSLDWLRWPGYALLFWAMTAMCPTCRTPSSR